MNFSGSTVTNQVQSAATGNWNTITMGFTARAADGSGESTQDRWKKFFPNEAKLIVDYDSKPGAPNGLQVAGVACGSGVLTIGTLTPAFSAAFPDVDKSDSLTGAFEWVGTGRRIVPYGQLPDAEARTPARTGSPEQPATSAAVTLAKGPTYAYRAKGTDKAPYSITGPWSGWCQFTVDTTVPPAPTVAPGLPGEPGRAMTFTFSTTTTDVTKFRYGWSNPPTIEISATGTNPKTGTVTVTVPQLGQNTLWAE